ncbi:hypothetical protein [Tenacibaculum jejuense]|uniref:Uncharacterized protein n=1 Tax=Tenacibaculum jejuense TaxID=584609 RepID=A0A238U9W6_9FLAO|nr:hypothetical protein [Tenacibaculum jejuense]SNR15338.1 Probable transmembrane protein of unknown function [Tenacibaculum jejuense]
MIFKKLSLQENFYVLYVYFILLGIVSDALFYAVLGVQYLNYVSILDALISPFSLLTDSLKLTLALVICFFLLYKYVTKWSYTLHKKYKHKKWYGKIHNIERREKAFKDLEEKKGLAEGLLFLFFILFVSLRLGMGLGKNHKIKTKEIKPNYELTFKDNSQKDVQVIGQNSSFIFYVEHKEKVVSVTPISDNIKQIKRIPKKD